ncbi:hypothetical protein Bca52824_035205 [Brassica carinata]|uniref:Uncharacterized protein n=1 Tax=Brassica carinata TaxID=52824 RepID=A0A8X7S071_BRACI|nr:hypothetical protein Bca52824_035205 [Brassica carinata]
MSLEAFGNSQETDKQALLKFKSQVSEEKKSFAVFMEQLVPSMQMDGARDLEFLVALSNCTQLQFIDVSSNRLGGDLPASIANMSMNLNQIYLRNNSISGSIPHGIGNLIGLQTLVLSDNLLKGPIPASIGKLSGLVGLGVHINRMSGEIPYSLGNITRLEKLYLYSNSFEGIIPPSLGKCSHLLDLHTENNKLNEDVGRLENLAKLSVAYNKLSGKLPKTLGKCLSLEELHMQGNSFDGIIPDISSCIRFALPEQVLDVADELILHNVLRIGFPAAACLTQVLEVGLGCSEESPANRLGMSEVVKELISIKERFVEARRGARR